MAKRKSLRDRPKTHLTPVEAATIRPKSAEIVPVANIIAHPEIQVRTQGLNPEWVDTFVNILQSDGELEPIVVYRVDDKYYVADGFHRLAASIQASVHDIRAYVHQGTFEDAKDHAESANLEHGLYLTNQDKKNILYRRLEREHEWIQLSNRKLASILGVAPPTIGEWLTEFSTVRNLTVDRSQTVGADGKKRDTSKIGIKSKSKPTWTPKKAKTRLFKTTETFFDDDLFNALNELEETDRDEAFGRLYDLRKRLDDLLGD